MKYELMEDIIFEGIAYPPTCDYCGERIEGTAIVFPLLKKIFCDGDCAANWYASKCRYINSIKEAAEPCIPS